jgi:DNA-binding transcriptional regulator YiaG
MGANGMSSQMSKRGPKESGARSFNSRAEFCQRIKNLRIFLGLDHKSFARQIGVTQFTVYRWERKQSNFYPGKKNWKKILRLEEINF